MNAYGKIAMFGQREPEQSTPTLMIPQRDPSSVTGVARRHRKGARSALLLGDLFMRPKQQHENAI